MQHVGPQKGARPCPEQRVGYAAPSCISYLWGFKRGLTLPELLQCSGATAVGARPT